MKLGFEMRQKYSQNWGKKDKAMIWLRVTKSFYIEIELSGSFSSNPQKWELNQTLRISTINHLPLSGEIYLITWKR